MKAKGSAGSAPHWDDYTGKQRLAEVSGRMRGPSGAHERLLQMAE